MNEINNGLWLNWIPFHPMTKFWYIFLGAFGARLRYS